MPWSMPRHHFSFHYSMLLSARRLQIPCWRIKAPSADLTPSIKHQAPTWHAKTLVYPGWLGPLPALTFRPLRNIIIILGLAGVAWSRGRTLAKDFAYWYHQSESQIHIISICFQRFAVGVNKRVRQLTPLPQLPQLPLRHESCPLCSYNCFYSVLIGISACEIWATFTVAHSSTDSNWWSLKADNQSGR